MKYIHMILMIAIVSCGTQVREDTHSGIQLFEEFGESKENDEAIIELIMKSGMYTDKPSEMANVVMDEWPEFAVIHEDCKSKAIDNIDIVFPNPTGWSIHVNKLKGENWNELIALYNNHELNIAIHGWILVVCGAEYDKNSKKVIEIINVLRSWNP